MIEKYENRLKNKLSPHSKNLLKNGKISSNKSSLVKSSSKK